MAIRDLQRFEENAPAGFDGLFDWDFLTPCWPRGIEPCDVDAQVEIGGHFLKFETRSYPHDPLLKTKRGQAQTIVRSMQRMGQYLTYILTQGKTPDEIGFVYAMRYEWPEWKLWLAFGREVLVDFCCRWSTAADNNEVLCLDELSGWQDCKSSAFKERWRIYQLDDQRLEENPK